MTTHLIEKIKKNYHNDVRDFQMSYISQIQYFTCQKI